MTCNKITSRVQKKLGTHGQCCFTSVLAEARNYTVRDTAILMWWGGGGGEGDAAVAAAVVVFVVVVNVAGLSAQMYNIEAITDLFFYYFTGLSIII